MRWVRFRHGSEEPKWGWIDEEGRVGEATASPFGAYTRKPAEFALDEVQLLAPTVPTKIVCIGRNYVEHAREHNAEVPTVPLMFLKPPSALIGTGQPIVLPPQSQQVEHEAELAVVIGKRGRWIPVEEALSYVFGYTIANDVTARDLQRRDGQWTRGKGFDTFCPLGPWIETEVDPADLMITCRVNDELRQAGSTRDMVFSVSQLIAFVSSVMTLEPGDVLLTGTPAGVGPLHAGDVVRIEIAGIGHLENPVVQEALPASMRQTV